MAPLGEYVETAQMEGKAIVITIVELKCLQAFVPYRIVSLGSGLQRPYSYLLY